MNLRTIFLNTESRLRPLWRGLLYVPTYLAAVLALGLGIVNLLRWLGLERSQERVLLVFGLTGAVASLAVAALFLYRYDRRPFGTLGLWFYRAWGRELATGVGLGVLMLSVVIGVEAAAGAVRFRWAGGTGQGLMAITWSFVLFLPAAVKEELELRGYLFQRLIDAIGPWPATATLSMLFGLLHLANPSVTRLSTANTVLIGVLLAVCYLKTRGLWLPAGVHFGWNFCLGYVYSLPVSGIVLRYRLLAAEVSGPTYLTGGNYGPEGSVVTTVVIVVAVVWLARMRKISVSAEMSRILK